MINVMRKLFGIIDEIKVCAEYVKNLTDLQFYERDFLRQLGY